MPLDEDEHLTDEAGDGVPPPRRWKRWKVALLAALGIVAFVLGLGWLNRETIADRLITGYLEDLGIPATYEIKEIGGGRQVLENLVIGDPGRPDLTIERIEVRTVLRFGLPRFASVTLVNPRLYGTYRDGELSFGSLDPAIFTDSEDPFELPDMDLTIRDGRGLIESDFGPLGIRTDGNGNLRGGYSGMVAATAPKLEIGGCEAQAATLYGKLSVTSARPRLEGPLRLGAFACKEQGVSLAKSAARIDFTADPHFDGGEAKLVLEGGPLRAGDAAMRSTEGTARLVYRKNALVGDFTIAGKALSVPQASLAELSFEGSIRSAGGFGRIDVQAAAKGTGLALGRALDASLADAAKAGEDTLLKPLLEQVRSALLRESSGSSLAGNFILRVNSEGTSLVVPQAGIKGGSGDTLVSFSRLQFGSDAIGGSSVAGNFATGGRGLPKIAGRMEALPGSGIALTIRMPEYRAGGAILVLPRLVVTQRAGGEFGFAGDATVTGAIPGGRVERLALPLEGSWSARSGLAMWRKCIALRFDALEVSALRLSRKSVPVCPPRGGAIVRSTPGGIKAVANLGRLDLDGYLQSSRIRITGGPLAVAWPGRLTARNLTVLLGEGEYVSDFRIGKLDGVLGQTIAGRFEDADVLLGAVPLDVLDAAGAWRYAGEVLSLSEASFRLEDREQVDRFESLMARDATLDLIDNVITAEARLREPASLREIVRTDLRHDLDTGIGTAGLLVDGVRFDDSVQPDTLSYLALGVIANARGTVRGTGRIDWNETDVASTGNFSTDALDFAAAFGPVSGLSGTVVFTDLLGLVTAPDQQLNIREINPGIEVDDGVLTFQMEPDYLLHVKGAKWPFLGGTLTLEPVTMTIGAAETLYYNLVIEGLDAGRFLERIEMDNLSATGSFSGKIPLIFDEDGGRIAGGRLVSLPPGGNVSYVGELTYEDLSAMGNFAFDALKSLDYKHMQIDLDGSLEGEIVTRVTLDGLRQGKLASRNFVTRQIAKLPIRFNLNVRAPFFRLVTSLRSLYDPEYLRNPETLGMMDLPVPPGEIVDPRTPPDTSIQPSDSEILP